MSEKINKQRLDKFIESFTDIYNTLMGETNREAMANSAEKLATALDECFKIDESWHNIIEFVSSSRLKETYFRIGAEKVTFETSHHMNKIVYFLDAVSLAYAKKLNVSIEAVAIPLNGHIPKGDGSFLDRVTKNMHDFLRVFNKIIVVDEELNAVSSPLSDLEVEYAMFKKNPSDAIEDFIELGLGVEFVLRLYEAAYQKGILSPNASIQTDEYLKALKRGTLSAITKNKSVELGF